MYAFGVCMHTRDHTCRLTHSTIIKLFPKKLLSIELDHTPQHSQPNKILSRDEGIKFNDCCIPVKPTILHLGEGFNKKILLPTNKLPEYYVSKRERGAAIILRFG